MALGGTAFDAVVSLDDADCPTAAAGQHSAAQTQTAQRHGDLFMGRN